MNADQRLDRLEPLLSESMAILDQHTALLNRHTVQLKQLVTTALQHSDSLSYVLHEVIEIKERQGEMLANQVGLSTRMDTLDGRMDALDSRIATLDGGMKQVDGKIDQILGLLSNAK